jgi:hypothetical protein
LAPMPRKHFCPKPIDNLRSWKLDYIHPPRKRPRRQPQGPPTFIDRVYLHLVTTKAIVLPFALISNSCHDGLLDHFTLPQFKRWISSLTPLSPWFSRLQCTALRCKLLSKTVTDYWYYAKTPLCLTSVPPCISYVLVLVWFWINLIAISLGIPQINFQSPSSLLLYKII